MVKNIHFIILSMTVFLHLKHLILKTKTQFYNICFYYKPCPTTAFLIESGGEGKGGSENYMIEWYIHDISWHDVCHSQFFNSVNFNFFFVTTKLTSIYICVDFIQSACTESLESQDQWATNHPPHPWSLWVVNHFLQALIVVLWLWVIALIWLAWPAGKILWLCMKL